MIKTTLGELVEAEVFLVRVAKREGFSFKTVYAISKMIRLVKRETTFWHEERNKLFLTLGHERDSSPQERMMHGPTVREIRPENSEEFRKLINELNSTEVTLQWNPLKSSELNGVTAHELIGLGPLCELIEPSDDNN